MGHEALGLFLAVLIGISLGALGSGGSIITLPILVYVVGVPTKSAIGMSICIVGATSLLGALLQWRKDNLNSRTVLLFCATGIPAAYVGSLATHLVPSNTLLLMFAALMLVVGSRMLLGKRPEPNPKHETRTQNCLLAGLGVGLITGFLGVGGGFLIVPALIWFAGLDTRKAIGTSLGIIAINSLGGIAGQLRYANWNWTITGEFFVCSLIGMVVGLAICHKVPAKALTKAFACAVLTVALGISWQVLAKR